MNNVTIAVDLAKSVFGVAVSNAAGRITERKRLSRAQFERFWADRLSCCVVLEACASSHFRGRWLRARGFDVVLLPPHYVRPYVRRNKTDRTETGSRRCLRRPTAKRCLRHSAAQVYTRSVSRVKISRPFSPCTGSTARG